MYAQRFKALLGKPSGGNGMEWAAPGGISAGNQRSLA